MITAAVPVVRLLRVGRTAVVLTVAAVSFAACSSGAAGADGPDDADVKDFCNVVGDLDVSDPEGFVEDLVEVGTPAGVSGDVREGYEILIDNADADEVSDADQEKVNAFLAYVVETCGAVPAG